MREPKKVDCAYVEERVQRFLDGELSEQEADELRFHLDACAHCIDGADLIETYRRLVQRSCACQAPESLRLRIVSQLRSVHGTHVQIHRP